jgi:hypothetical protein
VHLAVELRKLFALSAVLAWNDAVVSHRFKGGKGTVGGDLSSWSLARSMRDATICSLSTCPPISLIWLDSPMSLC